MPIEPAIESVEALEERLSRPTPAVVEAMRQTEGDVLVLGASGKMGPTLARMAVRASEAAGVRRQVIGVARFSDPAQQPALERHGVVTIRADLLDRRQLAQLPEAPNIVSMTGMKFGSTGQEPLTWAMNAFVAGLICERFCGSRIVAFSTGNVYPLTPIEQGGSREEDEPRPVGEYAMSALGRERMFEHFGRTLGFPLAILRLNYATELRYGVLVDLAERVDRGETIDLAMGNFNAIWQQDANAAALLALLHASTPPLVLNLAGPEMLSVRRVCRQFGELLDKPVHFVGQEARDALLSNSGRAIARFGYPHVGVEQMLQWIADWIRRGGQRHGKPTHFETRDGRF
ncbi:MAG TPA: NAD-dependent epimerase/dehydratase family protein [Pirellulales bacterium]|jgi:nucleoside-diphosphate-sugar epimerase|nr:NAD-dependent epimerase/dehydratase family protein [Pirellulales bacterium]